MSILAFLWGLITMATGTLFTEPVCFLCVPDARQTPSRIDRTNPVGSTTTATEANLQAEVVRDTSNITLPNGMEGARPIASGTPSSSFSLGVDVVYPGAVDQVGTYSIDDGTSVYGATPLWAPTGFETIRAIASGSGYQVPRGAALANGTVAVVYEDWDGTQGVGFRTRSDSTHAWSGTTNIWTVVGGGAAFTANIHPSPEIWVSYHNGVERINVASFVFADDISGTKMRLRIDYSTDAGATWGYYYSSLLLTVSSIYYDQIRVAYDPVGDQILLGVIKNDGGTYTGLYYVSNDGGVTFTQLTGANQTDVRAHDIRCHSGTFYATTIDGGGEINLLWRTALSSGWTVVSLVDSLAAAITDRCVALQITPDGAFWVDYRSGANPGILFRASSFDYGLTWSIRYTWMDRLTTFASGLDFNGSVYTTQRLYLLGTMLSSGTTVDNSLVALVSGGAATLSLENGLGAYAGFLPSDLPSTRSTQYVFAGGSAESITTDTAGELIHRIDNTNATGYYTVTQGAAELATQSAHWILSPDSSGGSTASGAVVLRVAVNEQTGVNTYAQVELRIDLTNRQVQAYDVLAAANLGTPVTYSTGTDGIEFYLSVNVGTSARACAYVRRTTSETWTPILGTTGTATTTAAGTTNTIIYGKTTATTAQVDTRYLSPGWWGNPVGPSSPIPPTTGIPARSLPDRLPQGIYLRWQGSPLIAGDSWTAQSRSSSPLEWTSPWSMRPSPTHQWRGTAGAAGATYRIVYNYGSSYRAKLSRGLIYQGWANAPGLEAVRLYARSAGAWVSQVVANTKVISMTNVDLERLNAASYQFYPFSDCGGNNLPLWEIDQFAGYWCVLTDGGGNTIAGTIAHNDPGHFALVSGGLPASLELDPSTVVAVAGTFAGFSLSTATATLSIYAPDGVVIGVQGEEAEQYYAIEVDLAPGATLPEAGMLPFGAAYPLARQVRDGSSMRFIAPDELRVLPSGLMTGRRLGRKQQRIVELPYDQILLHVGSYSKSAAVPMNSMEFFSGVPRATIDNNLSVLTSVHRVAGQQVPIALVIDGDWTNDPANVDQNFVDQDVVFGYLENQVDVTAGRGTLRGRVRGHEHGSSLVVREIV